MTFGTGPFVVLMWSQMHGDEATATSALFDLYEYLHRHRGEPAVQRCSRADGPHDADAQPGRRRALAAPERAGTRHQSRRTAAAVAGRAAAQEAARRAEPARGLQPSQSELEHDGRQAAGARRDLAPVRRVRRGADRERGPDAHQTARRRWCATRSSRLRPAASAGTTTVRSARVRRQPDEVGDAGAAHRDGSVAGGESRPCARAPELHCARPRAFVARGRLGPQGGRRAIRLAAPRTSRAASTT